jgi:hypothetical protein
MAEKKASKEHKARDHSAIAQFHFSLLQKECPHSSPSPAASGATTPCDHH